MKLSLSFLLVVALVAPAVSHASSEGTDLDERAAIRNAGAAVLGSFSGVRRRFAIEVPGALDERGEPFVDEVEVTSHEFLVEEVLDGEGVPGGTIVINTPGNVGIPAAGARVVIGIAPDDGAPNGGYVMLYGKHLPAADANSLARLRDWVSDVRAPAPVDPQAVADRLGQLDAESRFEGVPEAPPVDFPPSTDDPSPGSQPRYDDAPVALGQDATPYGDPTHPPELDPSGPRAAAGPRGLRRAPGLAARIAGDERSVARAASPGPTSRRGWVAGAVAFALLGVAVAFERRRRRA